MRYADFKTLSRSLSLAEPTNITQELLNVGIVLLTERLPSPHLPVRLLGFGVNHLSGSVAVQQQLFEQPERRRHQELDRVADQIAERFGKSAIRRGARIDKDDAPP